MHLTGPNSAGFVQPIIIGHRGASGYLPDHTLESYSLAIELGADFIEPDLVATRDGVLIARHEPNLVATTDVASRAEFAARRRTATIDGREQEGFFAADFTLAEMKTLRAVQPMPERYQGLNGRFEVPTFAEIVALARLHGARSGRTIGVYPETKHPSYHRSIGLPLEDRLLEVLSGVGWNEPDAPVFIQSFEVGNLKDLRRHTGVRLIQLVDAAGVAPDGTITFAAPSDRPYDWALAGDQRLYSDLVTPTGLAEVAGYADGIGPWKAYLLAGRLADGAPAASVGGDPIEDCDRTLLPPSSLVTDAHAAGLVVHPFTFRNEARRLARDHCGEPTAEYRTFFELGVDGVFSDFPDTAFAARAQWHHAGRRQRF